ncbi:MAG: type II secretion system protein M [Burkholderiaceae bacterium]|nr:type II secretion system protein M [Ideonella sp.]MCC7285278.1 type II secretion system protein M [Burkholderiaceae bacterium]
MTDAWRDQWQTARDQAAAAWRARAPRERVALAAAAAVVIVLAGWALLVAPAWATLRAAPAQLETLDAQLQQMRGLAAEVRDLRNATPVAAAQAGLAIKAAAERYGDKVRLTLQADRAVLTLVNAGPEQLRALLVEARSAARARPIEAQLTRTPAGYSGTLVFHLGDA